MVDHAELPGQQRCQGVVRGVAATEISALINTYSSILGSPSVAGVAWAATSDVGVPAFHVGSSKVGPNREAAVSLPPGAPCLHVTKSVAAETKTCEASLAARPSLDQLGLKPDTIGDTEAERFRRPEIDEQLKFGRLLDRKVRGLGASQDLVDENRRPAPKLQPVREVRQERSRLNEAFTTLRPHRR